MGFRRRISFDRGKPGPHLYRPGDVQHRLTSANSAGSAIITKQDYIRVIGTIGGDKGYFLVHSNVDGAAVLFDRITPEGFHRERNTDHFRSMSRVPPPYRTFTLSAEGYTTLTQNITSYPGKDETIDLYANLTPVGQPPVADFNGTP